MSSCGRPSADDDVMITTNCLNINELKITTYKLLYFLTGTDENKETVCITKEVEFIDGATRPVWFVYSGMGSQWATMGAELMRIPIFAAAIERLVP